MPSQASTTSSPMRTSHVTKGASTVAAATAVALAAVMGGPVVGLGAGVAGASSSGHAHTHGGASPHAPHDSGAPKASQQTSKSPQQPSTSPQHSSQPPSTTKAPQHSSHPPSTTKAPQHSSQPPSTARAPQHSPQPPSTSPQHSSQPSGAQGASAPPGNNGTIKIDQTKVSTGPGMEANHPHVSCSFLLAFFGYDTGTRTATISLTAMPPSGSFTPVMPTTGPTSTTFTVPARRSGNQLDATYTYRLDVSGLKAARQGYHIKVTVDVTGSKGADEKHKVFWYEPCTSTTGTPASSSSGSSTSRSSSSGSSSSGSSSGSRSGASAGTGTGAGSTGASHSSAGSTGSAPASTGQTSGSTRATGSSAGSSGATGSSRSAASAGATTSARGAPTRQDMASSAVTLGEGLPPVPGRVSLASSSTVPTGAPGTGGTPPVAGEGWLAGVGAAVSLLGVAAWERRRRFLRRS